jgi:hypothetical protein
MQPDAEEMDTIISGEVGVGSVLQAEVVSRPCALLFFPGRHPHVVHRMCVNSGRLKTEYPSSFGQGLRQCVR